MEETLREIGLTDYESRIYLSLLKNGQISAYELAEKTGLYRQVTYDSIKRLIEKGFVSSVKEGKSQKYKAIDPNLILEYLDRKTENYKEILPELIKLNQASKSPMIVETFKGKEVTRIALRDIINVLKKTKGENLCTSVDENFAFAKHKAAVEEYERGMIHNNIKERIVVGEDTKGLFERGTSKYKRIPKQYFNPNPTQIYGDNVSIVVWGNPDHLIIIRNKEVADSYRKQFELLWKIAKS
ncbi:winged helix-turn-helix transcriptional regulator [Candidatus Woesearchaeota archaeon]|nr:winged helix-turn-helix transcriptional regulator [Candidatus Woesearchaeota archaeon]